MKAIYEPTGRAREYSPLACNLYQGTCPHRCLYCWAEQFNKRTGRCGPYQLRPGILEALAKEAPKYSGDPRRVLLCFTGDPYPPEGSETTARALEILWDNSVRFSVLTKGGMRAARDFGYYQESPEGDWFGQTVAAASEYRREQWEPESAPLQDRVLAFQEAHRRGIWTWVSMEPVLVPEETLYSIEMLAPVVDEFRVGKLNYMQPPEPVDWREFALATVETLQATGCKWMLKQDLAKLLPAGVPSAGGPR